VLNLSVVRLASGVWHVLWCLPYWAKGVRLARERHGTTVLLLRESIRGCFLSQISGVVARPFARRPGMVLWWWSQYCLAACGRGWGCTQCLRQAARSWPCMFLLSVFPLLLWTGCRRGVRWRGHICFRKHWQTMHASTCFLVCTSMVPWRIQLHLHLILLGTVCTTQWVCFSRCPQAAYTRLGLVCPYLSVVDALCAPCHVSAASCSVLCWGWFMLCCAGC
jgi:hypothetical protein